MDPVLQPAERFEWERILRRIRMPNPVRGTGFLLATYADADGGRVHPGIQRLMTVSGVNEKTIRRHISALRDMGLIDRTKHGNRHAGQADEYRLTVPSDAWERLQMLDPDELITVVYRTPMSVRPAPDEASTAMSNGHSEQVYRTFEQCLPDTDAHPPTQLHQPPTKPEPHLPDVSHQRATTLEPTDPSRPGHSNGYLAAIAVLDEKRKQRA